MQKKTKIIISFAAALLVAILAVIYFRQQVYFSHGSYQTSKIFEIQKGEGNAQIASHLQEEGIISNKIYFYFYLRTHHLTNKILPGNYQLSGALTIPEIAIILTEQKNEFLKITFPEGWTMKQMADRLTANQLPGQDFLAIAQTPPTELLAKFDFLLSLPKGASLEGYLFPDTYFFSKDAMGSGIVQKMLNNFGEKMTPEIREEITGQNKKIFEIITMASLVESEVQSAADRKIVSGIFWNRIAKGQRLQSDATLTYILDDKTDKHTLEQTKINSPYNTYANLGLPPGPISNPSLEAIDAAIHPAATQYNYFLTADGQTIFSKTFEEHSANKVKYGL